MLAAIAFVAGSDEPGLRMMIRATARTSVVLFTLAFTASALRRAWPSPATRWMLKNRRQLGVSFAVSHFAHLVLLFALAQWSFAEFVDKAAPAALVLGGVAYVFVALMTLTSFDATAAWLGPRAGRRLHPVGAWWICFFFAVSFVPRVFESVFSLPFALLVLAAPAVRLASRRLARRTPGTETRV